MNKQGFAPVLLLFGLLIIILGIVFVPVPYYQNENVVCKMGQENCPQKGWHWGQSLYQRLSISNNSQSQPTCTLEAKICPDGSSVGRNGQNCEFSDCPTGTKTITEESAKTPIPAVFSDNVVTFTAPGVTKYYFVTLSFNRFTEDKISLIDQEKNIYRGITIDRNGVIVEVEFSTEGMGVTYDKVPEHVNIENTNISKLPITRVKLINEYVYVSRFGVGKEQCSHWNPIPAACSVPGVVSPSSSGGLNISCKTNGGAVATCDDIVKSIIMKAEALDD